MLQAVKALGTYLVIGVLSDMSQIAARGRAPIMTLNERVLSVMGCKLADDVLIDCPPIITEEMMSSLKIDVVATFRQDDDDDNDDTASASDSGDQAASDPLNVPRARGVLVDLDVKEAADDADADGRSFGHVTAGRIIARIHASRERYAKKFARKIEQEKAFYKSKYGAESSGSVDASAKSAGKTP